MNNRWVILAILFLARSAMGLQFQSIASSAPFLIHDLGFTHAQIGSLIGLYMLPGVFISLPGGMLGKFFGDRAISTTGLALMLLGGLLTGVAHEFGWAFAGRLMSGVGSILLNIVLTKMATDWFAEDRLVLAMAILMASWPFGIAAGLVVHAPIALAFGWSWVMLSAAALCGLALFLVLVLYRPAPFTTSLQPAAPADHQLVPSLPPRRESLPAMVAGAIWGVYNLGFVLFISFVPLLLSERGMPQPEAAAQVSIALWICAFSIPLGGLLLQRTGHANAALAAFSAVSGAMLLLVFAGVSPAILCAVMGLSIGPPPGAIMALPARVLSVGNRATGFGLFYTCNYLVSSLGPAAAGLLHDALGSAMAPVYLGAGCFFAVTPLLVLFLFLAARSSQPLADRQNEQR
jgi:MFS family permease